MSMVILGLLLAAVVLAGIACIQAPKSVLPWAVLILAAIILLGRL